MTINTIVWCFIIVSMNVNSFNRVEQAETAAKGRVTKVEGDYIYVDFSKYAREQKYIGDYYNIKAKSDECTRDVE
jgi:hypothetical protein